MIWGLDSSKLARQLKKISLSDNLKEILKAPIGQWKKNFEIQKC